MVYSYKCREENRRGREINMTKLNQYPKAAEIRANAANYNSDRNSTTLSLKDGFELWGTATGSIPYHRQWWILKGDEVVGHLDQGCYENSGQASVERREWARSLGCLGQLCVMNKETRSYEFV